jgi:hypothetical protein
VSRNPRGAYNPDGTEIAPMTLGNMRSIGCDVRQVQARRRRELRPLA